MLQKSEPIIALMEEIFIEYFWDYRMPFISAEMDKQIWDVDNKDNIVEKTINTKTKTIYELLLFI